MYIGLHIHTHTQRIFLNVSMLMPFRYLLSFEKYKSEFGLLSFDKELQILTLPTVFKCFKVLQKKLQCIMTICKQLRRRL